MSSDLPLEIASTLQTASIQARPDPRHDLNPSTAASKREPVTIAAFIATPSSPSSRHHQPHPTTTTTSSSWNFNDDDDDDDGIDYDDDDDNNNNNNNNRKTTAGAGRPSDPSGMIPISAIQPVGRRKTMPPLPDLRFEQNYLKSIEAVASWRGVAWVTVRDQVCLSFVYFSFLFLVLNAGNCSSSIHPFVHPFVLGSCY